MHPHFPLRTWTICPDYGGAPIVWELPGKASTSYLGLMSLHAHEMVDIVPDPLGEQFDAWGCAWESLDPSNIDWASFHLEGLRMSALLALWVSPLNIIVRYTYPYEDPRFSATDNEMWMEPGAVAKYADGLPSLVADADAWDALLVLHGHAPIGRPPTRAPGAQGCASP